MPAGAGTPRYENWVRWSMEGFRGRLCPQPLPLLGTSPSATSLLRPSVVVVRATVVGVAGRYRNPSRIGVRDMLSYQSPVPIATRTRRYNNGGRWLVEVLECLCRLPRLPWIPTSAGMTSWATGMTGLAGVTWTRKRHWNHIFAHHGWRKGMLATCRA